MADTTKVMQIDHPRTPKHTVLHGDKHSKTESATYAIEFPGGCIEVTRASDGTYWAHIAVNHGQAIEDAEGLVSKQARIVDSRIDRFRSITDIPDINTVQHIAVRIATV